jgi:hypothetical protein
MEILYGYKGLSMTINQVSFGHVSCFKEEKLSEIDWIVKLTIIIFINNPKS